MTTPTTPPATGPLAPADDKAAQAAAAAAGEGAKGAKAPKEPKAPRAPRARPAASQAAAQEDEDEGYTLPVEFASQPGADLLLEACEAFGVDPDQELPIFNPTKHTPTATTRFRELMAYRYAGANRNAGELASITLVTAGGFKGRYFSDGTVDQETEAKLRQIFRAFRVDKKTQEVTALPLPTDLTLPAEQVVGFSASDSHVLRRGYLREPRG